MDFSQKMDQIKLKFAELETELADPDIFSKGDKGKNVSIEHQRLAELIQVYDNTVKTEKELTENEEMLHEEEDPEFTEEIKKDIEILQKKKSALDNQLKVLIIPPKPEDSKNCIIEIRPAAGGDEAALFADELFKMYTLFGEKRKWKMEILELNQSDLKGLKNVTFSLSGKMVFREMSYESGVHRVQRIPVTESGGRIHTSTVTVAVLPETEEVDIQIAAADLKIDTYRAQGPGGQSVNTTDSAIRVTHIPTGIVATSQQEKSQHKNKELAMKILRARVKQKFIDEDAAKTASERKSQVGTGDRSERIRTYNYPQNRVSDHRYGITTYDLAQVLTGEMDGLIMEILKIEAERRLEEELKV